MKVAIFGGARALRHRSRKKWIAFTN